MPQGHGLFLRQFGFVLKESRKIPHRILTVLISPFGVQIFAHLRNNTDIQPAVSSKMILLPSSATQPSSVHGHGCANSIPAASARRGTNPLVLPCLLPARAASA